MGILAEKNMTNDLNSNYNYSLVKPPVRYEHSSSQGS